MRNTDFEHELLTHAEEIELAKRIEIGVLADEAHTPEHPDAPELRQLAEEGRSAWERFFSSNLRLAMHLARQAARRYRLDVDDLFQEACLGLGEALTRFDHVRGYRFSTFAYAFIHSRVDAAVLNRCGQEELPHAWLRRARNNRYQQQGPPKPPFAVASMAPHTMSNLVETSQEAQELPWWFDTLRERERRLLSLRFGLGCEPHSRREAGEVLGMSESQVRRCEVALLGKIRNQIALEAA